MSRLREPAAVAAGCVELDYAVDKPCEAPNLKVALCAAPGVGGHDAAVVLEPV